MRRYVLLPVPVIRLGLYAGRRIGANTSLSYSYSSASTSERLTADAAGRMAATNVAPRVAGRRITALVDRLCEMPPTGRPRLDASRAAEADRHGAVVHDHRNGASALGEAEHALELRRILLDVDVLERHVPPLTILPGGLRIRSSVLAKNRDHPPIVKGPGPSARRRRGSWGQAPLELG